MNSVTDPYVPVIPRHPNPPTESFSLGVSSGSGVPSAPGENGDFYTDINTSNVYLFNNGVWNFFASGGSSGNTITIQTTAPVGNGNKAGDLWINKSNLSLWFWDGAQWTQEIAP